MSRDMGACAAQAYANTHFREFSADAFLAHLILRVFQMDLNPREPGLAILVDSVDYVRLLIRATGVAFC